MNAEVEYWEEAGLPKDVSKTKDATIVFIKTIRSLDYNSRRKNWKQRMGMKYATREAILRLKSLEKIEKLSDLKQKEVSSQRITTLRVKAMILV